jgi:hypothetical protein
MLDAFRKGLGPSQLRELEGFGGRISVNIAIDHII